MILRRAFSSVGRGLMEVLRAAAILLFAFTCLFLAVWIAKVL